MKKSMEMVEYEKVKAMKVKKISKKKAKAGKDVMED